MMSVHCPRHGTEVLIGHRQILGIDGHGHGHDLSVRWQCWCGHQGTTSLHAADGQPAAQAV
jgi:hypothetical protein